jgi:spore coat polysaccharide biosynthesis protein SpsF
VQARCGSTRLPGKVLADILGHPMLYWVVNRVRAAKLVDQVVVATSEESRDDAVEQLCRAEGWDVFRGSENDVLDRYHGAATAFGADVVVRVTADCPLIDPQVIDSVITAYMADPQQPDYASNTQRRTFPAGLDTEVFSMAALRRAWSEDKNPAWREHVTPFIYRSKGGFRLVDVLNDTDESTIRWTVDTPEDLALVREIYRCFGNGEFSWTEALGAMQAHPDWKSINADVRQKELR